MAEINTTSAIDIVRGKFKKADKGYFYIRNGKQFYRDREETYQQNQSPKQKYNSEVFAYANAYMAQNYGTPERKAQLKAEFWLKWQNLHYTLVVEIQLPPVRIPSNPSL